MTPTYIVFYNRLIDIKSLDGFLSFFILITFIILFFYNMNTLLVISLGIIHCSLFLMLMTEYHHKLFYSIKISNINKDFFKEYQILLPEYLDSDELVYDTYKILSISRDRLVNIKLKYTS
jgi:hypothetical protein